MIRPAIAALAPALLLLLAGGARVAAATVPGFIGAALIASVRQACDVDGRCYETGDPGYRDDDAPPPPRRRFDPGDDDRPPPPPRRRYSPDDDDR